MPEREPLEQQSLWQEEKPETITLEACIVEALPTYRRGKVPTWDCVVYAPPDIFHQERNETYHVHATTYAQEANKKRLRPGDIVTLTGFPSTQELELQNGETTTIHHLTVSEITVLKQAKRESITVYERKQRR